MLEEEEFRKLSQSPSFEEEESLQRAQPKYSKKSKGRNRQQRIVLSGWYGHGNLGDEAILQSFVSILGSMVEQSDVSVTVLSERPEVIRRIYALRSLAKTNRVLDTWRRIFEISRADIFILGGGGILMDYGDSNKNVSKWLGDMKIAQELGVPTMALGIGVGKIWAAESEKLMKEVLSKADVICARDLHSAASLSVLGVRENVNVAADISLLLPNLEPLREKKGVNIAAESWGKMREKSGPTILVCLRHWYVTRNETVDKKIFSEMLSSLARMLSQLCSSENATVKFMPCSNRSEKNDDDYDVAKEVADLTDNPSKVTLLRHVPQMNEFLELLSDCDLLIGMRLHSLILASAVGVPCIGINYDEKVTGYMSSIGASRWTLEPKEATFESLVAMAKEALKQSRQGDVVMKLIEEKRLAARRSVELALELARSSSLNSSSSSASKAQLKRYVKAGFLSARKLGERLKEIALLTLVKE